MTGEKQPISRVMLQKPAQQNRPNRSEPSFAEFIAILALMTALPALSVDIMLPALGTIGHDLGLSNDNDRQLVISFYLIGSALGQLLWGPVADRTGRKLPLYLGLAVYMLGAVASALATGASLMFVSRIVQGIGAAAPRIIAVAIVRDRFAGREMARVMSFVMMVFIIMPILAPSMGQVTLLLGSWRLLFAMLVLISLATLVWGWLRLEETHPPEKRTPLTFARLVSSLGTILTTRQTLGYGIAFSFFFGVLFSYIGSAEQIFVDVYGLGRDFPLVFGAIASVMVLSSLTNARLVGRLGMRRVSHTALFAFLFACGVMALFGFPEKPPLIVFCLFIAWTFFCFGLIGPNFNAMAMEPMGRIAGTASSFNGFMTTGVGAFFGYLVGQAFDGTVRPLMIGYTTLGLACLIAVLIVERGRLARPQHEGNK
jgi:DHA1 family bicyclomycin/chloramphenicol resistance-like MFS transporter